MRTAAIIIVLALAPSACATGGHRVEADYVAEWCADGRIEYTLPDRTRVDCLTETHAVEFDYAPKWAEAVGQSLYYAISTGKRPGIVLIMRPGDRRFAERVAPLAERYGITVWEVER